MAVKDFVMESAFSKALSEKACDRVCFSKTLGLYYK